MTEQKARFCYNLSDSTYDTKTIKDFIIGRRSVLITDPNKSRNADCILPDPAKRERYKIRDIVERADSHLKDNLLPKAIYVKGTEKVFFVLNYRRFVFGRTKATPVLYMSF